MPFVRFPVYHAQCVVVSLCQLRTQCSAADILWALLSHAMPFWASVSTGPSDALTVLVSAHLQPLLTLLLDILNGCWHLHVQHCVVKILIHLSKIGSYAAAGIDVPFASDWGAMHPMCPYVCLIAVECWRLAAFYSGPSAGVDLANSSVDSRNKMLRAVWQLLQHLQKIDFSAARLVQESVTADARAGDWIGFLALQHS